MSTSPNDLAGNDYWDELWALQKLPAEVRKGRSPVIDKITDVLDAYLPRQAHLDFLEIGGAPAQWLVYVARTRRYNFHLLDYSSVGLKLAARNLEMLNVEAAVHYGDMFDDTLNIGSFDVVMSLGVIEHFGDLTQVVRAHAKFLRPGGTLILGVPNFSGVKRVVKRFLSPQDYARHNLASMKSRAWDAFEYDLALSRVYRGYVGGFEARAFRKLEHPTPLRRLVWLALTAGSFVTTLPPFRLAGRINTPFLSAYLIGVYRTPETR
jgi:SAM-dependent methyltransferase